LTTIDANTLHNPGVLSREACSELPHTAEDTLHSFCFTTFLILVEGYTRLRRFLHDTHLLFYTHFNELYDCQHELVRLMQQVLK